MQKVLKGDLVKMTLNCKCPFYNQNATITVILLGIGVFCFAGCYRSSEILEQEGWHEDLSRAHTVEYEFRDSGAPLLATEQLITLVGEPDYKITPAEFEERMPEDKPLMEGLSYCEWHMERLWQSYRRCKKQRRGDSKIITAETWRDSPEFNECLLWIYDESLHFSKPLHSNDWLHCLFCGKWGFSVEIYFVEDSQVVGTHHFYTYTNKPLLMKEK